jgi:hypothetical protein
LIVARAIADHYIIALAAKRKGHKPTKVLRLRIISIDISLSELLSEPTTEIITETARVDEVVPRFRRVEGSALEERVSSKHRDLSLGGPTGPWLSGQELEA